MSKFIKLLAAAGMMAGLLAFAPTAEAQGDTAVECTVIDGTVTITAGGPIDDQRTSETEYKFVGVEIQCVGIFDGGVIDGVYDVEAEGKSRGIRALGFQWEDCEQAESVPNTGEITSATLQAGGSGPASLTADYEFTRLGSVVSVNGTIRDGNGNSASLTAELQFTPTPLTDLEGCSDSGPGSDQTGIDEALLQGAAVLAN